MIIEEEKPIQKDFAKVISELKKSSQDFKIASENLLKSTLDQESSAPKTPTKPVEITPEISLKPVEITPEISLSPLEATPEISLSPLEITPEINLRPLEITPEINLRPLEATPEINLSPLEITPEISLKPIDFSKLYFTNVPDKTEDFVKYSKSILDILKDFSSGLLKMTSGSEFVRAEKIQRAQNEKSTAVMEKLIKAQENLGTAKENLVSVFKGTAAAYKKERGLFSGLFKGLLTFIKLSFLKVLLFPLKLLFLKVILPPIVAAGSFLMAGVLKVVAVITGAVTTFAAAVAAKIAAFTLPFILIGGALFLLFNAIFGWTDKLKEGIANMWEGSAMQRIYQSAKDWLIETFNRMDLPKVFGDLWSQVKEAIFGKSGEQNEFQKALFDIFESLKSFGQSIMKIVGVLGLAFDAIMLPIKLIKGFFDVLNSIGGWIGDRIGKFLFGGNQPATGAGISRPKRSRSSSSDADERAAQFEALRELVAEDNEELLDDLLDEKFERPRSERPRRRRVASSSPLPEVATIEETRIPPIQASRIERLESERSNLEISRNDQSSGNFINHSPVNHSEMTNQTVHQHVSQFDPSRQGFLAPLAYQ